MKSNEKYWKVLKSIEIQYFSILPVFFNSVRFSTSQYISILFNTYDYDFVFVRNEKYWKVRTSNGNCKKVLKSNEK